jgi:hypothetical protein
MILSVKDFLKSVNQMIIVTNMRSLSFDVRTEFLNII